MRVVIFDIDGTLADSGHRLSLIAGSEKDWDAFYDALDGDRPQEAVMLVAETIYARGIPIILCTGRPERFRRRTLAWIEQHSHLTPTLLYMRRDDDHRPDFEVKREMLHMIRAGGLEPLLVVEDRASCVQMWREEGLVCLQCAPGDF